MTFSSRLFVMAVFLAVVSAADASGQPASSQIRLNQIGFYPQAPKVAAVVGAATNDFYVTTPDLADTVYAGTLTVARTWTAAGESVRRAEFTSLETPGTYVIAVPGLGVSHPFEVAPYVHQEVARGALKAYYFQRASTALRPAYAGVWSRPAGHPDDRVLVHPSAATDARPAGTVISAPRGWYDAGDYNKYVVNSGISTGTLLMLYEHYPAYVDALDTNIPESDNGVPDLLDEVLWNLRWMLAMQDPGDGGVYHKLTTPNFEGMVMPNRAVQQRYVVQKGTAATLNFAAVMALAARIYDDFEADFPGLADSMRTAAQHAWNWAQVNPGAVYDQDEMNRQYDPDVRTGEYGDDDFFDEFRWAAAELFITTRQDSFVVMYPPFTAPAPGAPAWPYVDPLAFISLAHHRADVAGVVDTAEVKQNLIALANQYVNLKRESPYGMVMGRSGDFYWGSNSLAANQSMMLLQAYRLTGDDRYRDAALSNLDYLLGRNATGYSFVTGYGDRTPMHPHHRPSEADAIRDPVPGLLVGGPNADAPRQGESCPTYLGRLPATTYVDHDCSYATNEVTINWNAPLVYVAGALEALFSPTGTPTSVDGAGAWRPGVPQRRGITTYPSPVAGTVHVRFGLDAPGRVALRVFDLLGRDVLGGRDEASVGAGEHEWTLDLHALPAGLYLLQLHTAYGSQVHPIVVAR